ncbi:Dynein heavy chain 17 [Phytophthora cinnamomi]|uniref:Dynein heavy chain 17 n=1 Tax=Phytophthora cinnamomi TaxID=4785 RepID=UPI00355A0B19|nr:Dynein heavy chain 17 [Phytophthora cinnamomi]
MMSTPRGSSRSSSRRSESPVTTSKKSNFTVTSLHSGGESNALLRTSPWTYRGVVYFVSFFLQQVKERLQQQDEEESADEPDDRRLMIKIYEPMSSVESQMSVDTEDLRQDFGEQALVAFQSGQYRTLCDLMLQQLDRMMGTKAAPPTPPQPPKDTIPTAAGEAAVESPLLQDGGRKQASAVDLLLQDSDGDYEDRVDRPEVVDEPTADEPTSTSSSPPNNSLDVETLEASALKIQCAARQQQARGKVNRVRTQKKQAENMDASALRIQCAARQKQARLKVDRVRVERAQQADAVPETDEDESCDAIDEPDSRDADVPEVDAAVVPPESRPGTVMSYASDQFEDDVRDNELDTEQ